jgi:hypothetical protein
LQTTYPRNAPAGRYYGGGPYNNNNRNNYNWMWKNIF